ncbi:MAG: DeoR/GlpR transcriptional regulator, partial [Firmicutes bacterium]|nr:DeoR/GlpR transcriptional regulator [Bacillota bacterium]
MLKEQRCDLILSELRKKSIITIEEITKLTNSSRSTICRDIDMLEARHLLRRIRGGVSSYETETSFKLRQDLYLDEKKRIAAAARKMVNVNETLFLNCGTTIYELAKTLGDVPSPLYVATNDLKSATVLAEYSNIQLTVLGGSLRQSHYSLNGYFT